MKTQSDSQHRQLPDHTFQYWVIELLAFWEGEVSTPQLIEHLRISRQQASKYLNEYKLAHPANLTYCNKRKRYLPTPHFQAGYICGEAHEYLEWIAGYRKVPDNQGHLTLPFVRLQAPTRHIAPDIMRPLIQAVRYNQRVEVDYRSVSRPDSEGRIIVPHTFVCTGLRWHVRAWCEKNRDFRDFVLSRFAGQAELLGPSDISAQDDHAWNEMVTAVLKPDPRLSTEKRAAIEYDYGMHDGILKITTRAALMHYQLQELRVNVKMIDGSPEAQQLILVNFDEIRRWLFSA